MRKPNRQPDFKKLLSEIREIQPPAELRSPYKAPLTADIEELAELVREIIIAEPCAASKGAEAEASLRRLFDIIKVSLSNYKTESYREKISEEIIAMLPEVKAMLISDAVAIYEGDPAARSIDEIMLCYPGFFAITVYRAAHIFYQKEIPFLSRMLSEYAHRMTGIDIHPGARIGRSFCIDHGTGIVIGETAEIGDRVKIYQGVTVGAKSFPSDSEGRLVRGEKRHPTIGDDCIIYADATILGGDTVIGDRSVIGGNVWLTHSVPENSIIYRNEKPN